MSGLCKTFQGAKLCFVDCNLVESPGMITTKLIEGRIQYKLHQLNTLIVEEGGNGRMRAFDDRHIGSRLWYTTSDTL